MVSVVLGAGNGEPVAGVRAPVASSRTTTAPPEEKTSGCGNCARAWLATMIRASAPRIIRATGREKIDLFCTPLRREGRGAQTEVRGIRGMAMRAPSFGRKMRKFSDLRGPEDMVRGSKGRSRVY